MIIHPLTTPGDAESGQIIFIRWVCITFLVNVSFFVRCQVREAKGDELTSPESLVVVF